MDVQLQELIEKIKTDGVASAEASAAAIIADAEKKAAAIIADAEEKAAAQIQNAKAETVRMEKASIDAIRQAGRNLLISFRDAVSAELSALITAEIKDDYNSDMLKTLIPEVVKAWTDKDGATSLSVLLSQKDLAALEGALKTALKKEIEKGMTIKSDDSLSAGFRIGVRNDAAYYDFSAESVAELFSGYLNPRVAQLLKEAAAEGTE
ncbi:MAG: hypothetical protein NC041_04405 [Bacteroides sp.]|nr:hypothetical protein [Prevotella sp.]MCM1407948.1 V-type ATP synthase subunit E [Treponema brennaborense]MCM1469690.1 hypothetical protein [Bacteroides sp.]